jgi:nucleotide-binding universal stress UspA family protein
MFKNILVAVDGSDHSLKAARLAGDLARLTNAGLCMVTAFDPIPSFLGEPDRQRVTSAHLKAAEEAAAKGSREIGEVNGKLEQEIIEGPAAEAIIRIAETRSSDLIIMGTRGLGQLSGWVLGSQSQKVVSHAPCPVLLAR